MAITALSLQNFGDPNLSEQDLLARLSWLRDVIAPRLERYLGYYRNPTSALSEAFPCAPGAYFPVRPFRQFQELGLPARITGFKRAADGTAACNSLGDMQRKEVVIENDIAWRMDTLVDFVAARLPGITSTASDPARGAILTRVIGAILDAVAVHPGAGGCVQLLQELTLQGLIGGSTWVHIRPTPQLLARLAGSGNAATVQDSIQNTAQEAAIPQTAADMATWLALEVADARCVCPIQQTAGGNCDSLAGPAYVAVLRQPSGGAAGSDASSPAVVGGFLQRVRAWFGGGGAGTPVAEQFSFDIFGAAQWQRYDRGALLEEGENPLGVVPFVRYENSSDPAAGSRVGTPGSGAVDVGIGDVEPLIGLQDELNTRLSDRAYRVTMSSFRMFLGKGIEDFIKRPIGPGQMWGTDNLSATIESFGGDQATPSEDSHIGEVRQALDKISGVPPVAAGILEGKVGNLTSAIALQITLIALLARTQRKRAALAKTLAEVVRMALSVLDAAGVVKSLPEERGIDVNWPTPIPESDMDRLSEAQVKLALGVPRSVVLTELGYGELAAVQAMAQSAIAPAAPGEKPAAETPAPGNVAAHAVEREAQSQAETQAQSAAQAA